MTLQAASSTLTFRARRFPVWLCFGLSALLLLLWSVVAVAMREHLGLVLLFLVIVGLPGLLIFKMGNDVRRSRVVISDAGLDVRVARFRIWAFRPLASARLAWRDVHGVQPYEIPNFATPGGVQVDYVVHSTQGEFAVSSVQFADAQGIATLIAQRIGRAVGDLPAEVRPVGANTPSGRLGVRLMRALGWVAQAAGVVFLMVMIGAWLAGSPLPPSASGGLATASGVLLMVGRSLRRFSLK